MAVWIILWDIHVIEVNLPQRTKKTKRTKKRRATLRNDEKGETLVKTDQSKSKIRQCEHTSKYTNTIDSQWKFTVCARTSTKSSFASTKLRSATKRGLSMLYVNVYP